MAIATQPTTQSYTSSTQLHSFKVVYDRSLSGPNVPVRYLKWCPTKDIVAAVFRNGMRLYRLPMVELRFVPVVAGNYGV